MQQWKLFVNAEFIELHLFCIFLRALAPALQTTKVQKSVRMCDSQSVHFIFTASHVNKEFFMELIAESNVFA